MAQPLSRAAGLSLDLAWGLMGWGRPVFSPVGPFSIDPGAELCNIASQRASPGPAGAYMDWDKLKTFHFAAETGSLTAAAEKLGVSQSSVSRQIAALENDMGVPLFQRHARGLLLTGPGMALREFTREMAGAAVIAGAGAASTTTVTGEVCASSATTGVLATRVVPSASDSTRARALQRFMGRSSGGTHSARPPRRCREAAAWTPPAGNAARSSGERRTVRGRLRDRPQATDPALNAPAGTGFTGRPTKPAWRPVRPWRPSRSAGSAGPGARA